MNSQAIRDIDLAASTHRTKRKLLDCSTYGFDEKIMDMQDTGKIVSLLQTFYDWHGTTELYIINSNERPVFFQKRELETRSCVPLSSQLISSTRTLLSQKLSNPFSLEFPIHCIRIVKHLERETRLMVIETRASLDGFVIVVNHFIRE